MYICINEGNNVVLFFHFLIFFVMVTYAVYFISNDMNTCELFSAHFNKESARKALKYQLERLSNNENQATSDRKSVV